MCRRTRRDTTYFLWKCALLTGDISKSIPSLATASTAMWAYTIQQYALDDTCVDTNNHLDRYSSDRACTWSATVSMGYLLLQQLFSHGGYDIVAMGCDATQYTYTFPANIVAELDKTRGPQCHWSIPHQGLPSQDKCLNVVLSAMS